MNTNCGAIAMASVAAICSAVAVVSALTAFTAPAASQLYAPAITTVRPAVASMIAPQMQRHSMQYATAAAGPAYTEAVAYKQSVVSEVPQSRNGGPIAALMAIPVAVTALLVIFGRPRASAESTPLAMVAVTGERNNSRREFLASAAGAATALAAPAALAASGGIPKGFKGHKDPYDGYQFLYPFGWQEVSVQGQDVVYKDLIETLETVSVSITATEKASVTELGPVNDVCFTIADNFLTGRSSKVTLVEATQETEEGIDYYTMEFTAANNTYTRHALACLAICNGKLFTCVTGADERRWKKDVVRNNAKTVIDSFSVFKVIKTESVM